MTCSFASNWGLNSLEMRIQSCGEIATDRHCRALPPVEIHVWYRDLNFPFSQLEMCYELLSDDERERAARYHFDQHRNEFVLTRGTLRTLLGSYLEKSPASLAFSYSAQGKPYLAGEPSNLRFNVSHTEGLAALAFARESEIGVDVEKMRPEREAHKLAERFFSESERRFLSHISGRELHEAFFRCWTRKEAYIKAKGGGLSIPLDEFDVSIAKHEPVALLGTRPDPNEAGRWALHDLPVKVGYAGALAVSVPAPQPQMQTVIHAVTKFAQS
jgi:4'-phosphopantetheinyl transferase